MLVVTFVTVAVNILDWDHFCLQNTDKPNLFVFLARDYPREKNLLDAVKSRDTGKIKDLIKTTFAEAKDISYDVPQDKTHWTPLIYAGNAYLYFK